MFGNSVARKLSDTGTLLSYMWCEDELEEAAEAAEAAADRDESVGSKSLTGQIMICQGDFVMK